MALIDLDDLELVESARGQRALRDRALEDAARQENPGMRALFERSAKMHEALAERFDQARKARGAR
jgi:hypothetical protein